MHSLGGEGCRAAVAVPRRPPRRRPRVSLEDCWSWRRGGRGFKELWGAPWPVARRRAASSRRRAALLIKMQHAVRPHASAPRERQRHPPRTPHAERHAAPVSSLVQKNKFTMSRVRYTTTIHHNATQSSGIFCIFPEIHSLVETAGRRLRARSHLQRVGSNMKLLACATRCATLRRCARGCEGARR